jgi:alkanesulfonate monooxygenase SsuD/methylene tetrahydromethanopterin reductase-like flavin-dependent oxidoreductase (luciferase family)
VRFGIEIVTLGPYADPRVAVELAVAAEKSGFELVAVWDHLAFVWGVPAADPIVTLAAIAQATSRIRLLPFVLAIPRYQPAVLAHQLAQLDILSGGRLIVGAGLGGVAAEFEAFGHSALPAVRAAQADEALQIIAGLLSGERVDYAGSHYRVEGVQLAPLPLQQPRPPIWIGGESGGALRRAARWDGWAGPGVGEDGSMVYSAADVSRFVERLARAGAAISAGFDICLSAVAGTQGPSSAQPRDYDAAGLTWWLESISPSYGSQREMLDRVRAGPAERLR